MRTTDGRSSRQRILDLLRQGPATVDRIVTALGISRGAVRLQLATLARDGLVAQRGTARGATKPSATWEITSRGEVSLSRGYVPMLTQLLHVLSARLPPGEFDAVMREVGRSMLHGRERPSGPLARRVEQASALFNELGGLTHVERGRGRLFIRSHGCPFSATTERHAEACGAVESLFSEFIDAPVETCCEREPRLRCCFAVALRPPRAPAVVA
jgi:predicted ArsR family transcriptional regulator